VHAGAVHGGGFGRLRMSTRFGEGVYVITKPWSSRQPSRSLLGEYVMKFALVHV